MPTIGVPSAKAVARTRTPQSVASTAGIAQSENASVAGTATETENGTENIAESVKETRNETERGETAIENATENAIAIGTVSAVIGTDERRRIVIVRAGKSARSAFEPFSPRKTATRLLVRDIALLPLQMTHSGSDEDLVKMTYVSIIYTPALPTELIVFINLRHDFIVRPHLEAKLSREGP